MGRGSVQSVGRRAVSASSTPPVHPPKFPVQSSPIQSTPGARARLKTTTRWFPTKRAVPHLICCHGRGRLPAPRGAAPLLPAAATSPPPRAPPQAPASLLHLRPPNRHSRAPAQGTRSLVIILRCSGVPPGAVQQQKQQHPRRHGICGRAGRRVHPRRHAARRFPPRARPPPPSTSRSRSRAA